MPVFIMYLIWFFVYLMGIKSFSFVKFIVCTNVVCCILVVCKWCCFILSVCMFLYGDTAANGDLNKHWLRCSLHPSLVPNVDLPPLCSSRFRPGPPGEQAQAASQFVADVIERCDRLQYTRLSFHFTAPWCEVPQCLPPIFTHRSVFCMGVAALKWYRRRTCALTGER